MTVNRQVANAPILLLTVALFLVGTNAFVIAGVLPDIARAVDVSMVTVGYALTMYAVVVALISPSMSKLLAPVPRVTIMTGGMLVIAVGTLITALGPDFIWFAVGRVVAAVGAAALVPTAFAVTPTLVSVERRGRALAFVGLGFALALAVGSPLGTALASVSSWRMPLVALAALAAVIGALMPRVLAAAEGANVAAPAPRFRQLAGNIELVLLLNARLLMTAAFQMVYVYSAFVVHDLTGGDGAKLAILMSAYGFGGVMGGIAGGWMSDVRGTGRTGITALAALVLVLAGLAGSHGLFTAAAAFLAWGFTVSMSGVPQQHRLVDVLPEFSSATLAWNATAMYVGLAIAPVVGGLLVPHGPIAVVLGGAATAGLALLSFALSIPRVRRILVGAR
jgi:DHA1 family purine base/nucleoside efflux pump-like MFS transporter